VVPSDRSYTERSLSVIINITRQAKRLGTTKPRVLPFSLLAERRLIAIVTKPIQSITGAAKILKGIINIGDMPSGLSIGIIRSEKKSGRRAKNAPNTYLFWILN
jgi:hypothetical protein